MPVALVNDRLGLGFMVTTRKDQFPCMYEWQNLQAGQYALGIEPSSNHVLGNGAARERGELIRLKHGEERRYDTAFTVLPDAGAIAAVEARIAAIEQLMEFRERHREAKRRWCAGDRCVVFPAGTYWMKKHHAAACEPFP